jgi:hypothetical protein
MTIRDEIIDELLSGQDPRAVFAKDGLLDGLKRGASPHFSHITGAPGL